MSPAEHRMTRRAMLAGSAALLGATTLATTAPARAQADNTFFKTFGGPVVPLPAGPRQTLSDGYIGALRIGPDGVPLTQLNGGWVIHPTILGNYLNSLLNSYETVSGGQPKNLARVVTTMEALLARAARRNGAVFLKYEFPWHAFNGDLPDPWYSSFGQSKFPQVAWRLWKITGERRWLQVCRELVQAFYEGPVPGKTGLPWIAKVDPNHNLWLDEYPTPSGRESAVFNGHYYALHELSVYSQLSGDAQAQKLVSGAVQTLADYRNLCRHAGTFSHYFASTSANVPSYHYINTSCYLNVYNNTGWAPFATTVDQMISDWRFTEGKSAQLYLSGGYNHTIRKVTGSAGANAGSATTWKPGSNMVVASGARTQYVAFNGVWSRMDSGPRKGYWLLESIYGYPEGFDTDRCEYRFPRVLYFEKGKVTTFIADSRGHMTNPRVTTFNARSSAHTSLRAKVNGRQYAKLTDGSFAGRWAPLGGTVHF